MTNKSACNSQIVKELGNSVFSDKINDFGTCANEKEPCMKDFKNKVVEKCSAKREFLTRLLQNIHRHFCKFIQQAELQRNN